MNIAPGQNLLSRYGFTVQKRYEPLADGLVSAAEHSARLPADIQQATDAQARELEARRVGGQSMHGVAPPHGGCLKHGRQTKCRLF